MHDLNEFVTHQTRRAFLGSSALSLGALALGELTSADAASGRQRNAVGGLVE